MKQIYVKVVSMNNCMRAVQQNGMLQAFVYMTVQDACLYLLLCPIDTYCIQPMIYMFRLALCFALEHTG